MKFFKPIFILLILVIQIKAQNTYEFLRLDTSPRAGALAGSYVAEAEDPNVMFYNPAGIKSLEGTPISFSFLKHLLDINSASLAASHYFEEYGRFSAGVNYINYGNFTEADRFGNRTGEFGAGEMAIVLGYANNLDKNFYWGINGKFIYSSIADYSSTGYAFDLGLHYEIPESMWNFGFSILNLGNQLSSYIDKKENLPLDIKFGFSKELEHLPFRFFFAFNRLNEQDDSFTDRFNKFSFGGEFKLSKVLRLRFGYDNQKRKDLKIGTTAGLAGYNLGLGFLISDYRFDYAFSSLGSVGSLHRIGITTDLSKF